MQETTPFNSEINQQLLNKAMEKENLKGYAPQNVEVSNSKSELRIYSCPLPKI